ncbi:S24 family peptidase [Staphylococcus pseudintermedius]|uniref:S24 family peptidase n=1 Tax=Staphylococcus pseudintermedius TaxID=283734 RepID=UPI00291F14A4|nr:S24 family peptidase [Staphylococcus pseudintermedius]
MSSRSASASTSASTSTSDAVSTEASEFVSAVNSLSSEASNGSGQIGIFVIDGEAYLKKVFINEEGIRLVSLNSKYPDLNVLASSFVVLPLEVT